MNKDEIHELILGVALVALAYAAYRHFKAPAPTTPQPFKAANPLAPAPGIAYNPANPGQYISLDNLLNGAVHDLAANPGGSMNNYVTTDDLAATATGGTPMSARDSVFLPDAPTWSY